MNCMRFKIVKKNNEKLWLSFIEKLLTIYYTNLAISVFDKIIQHIITFEIFHIENVQVFY